MGTSITDRLVGKHEMLRMVGNLSYSSVFSWMKKGEFPPSRKIGVQKIGWLESELLEWIKSRQIAVGPIAQPSTK